MHCDQLLYVLHAKRMFLDWPEYKKGPHNLKPLLMKIVDIIKMLFLIKIFIDIKHTNN